MVSSKSSQCCLRNQGDHHGSTATASLKLLVLLSVVRLPYDVGDFQADVPRLPTSVYVDAGIRYAVCTATMFPRCHAEVDDDTVLAMYLLLKYVLWDLGGCRNQRGSRRRIVCTSTDLSPVLCRARSLCSYLQDVQRVAPKGPSPPVSLSFLTRDRRHMDSWPNLQFRISHHVRASFRI